MLDSWKNRVKNLKKEALVLYVASQDSRISRWQKLLVTLIIGYLFCPLDLIPDFIPILGYLDDLVLVPLGILLILKVFPAQVVADAREQVHEKQLENIPIGWKTAILVIILWIIGVFMTLWILLDLIRI